jgi:hypothetical protein
VAADSLPIHSSFATGAVGSGVESSNLLWLLRHVHHSLEKRVVTALGGSARLEEWWGVFPSARGRAQYRRLRSLVDGLLANLSDDQRLPELVGELHRLLGPADPVR